jgi:hypothetical protein
MPPETAHRRRITNSQKIPDLVVEHQRSRIDQEFDAATPQGKRHVVPAPDKSSPINDFRTMQGFICLNIILRAANLDDGPFLAAIR